MSLAFPKRLDLIALPVVLIAAAWFCRISLDPKKPQASFQKPAVSWILEEVSATGYEASRFKEIGRLVSFERNEFVITKFSRRADFFSWEIIGNKRAQAFFLEGAENIADKRGRLRHVDLGAGSPDLLVRLNEVEKALHSGIAPAWLKQLPIQSEEHLDSPWHLYLQGANGSRVFCFKMQDGRNEELVKFISTP